MFHQEASGHCSAPRNKGISEAEGEYLFFHDADDIMLPEACERMLKHAHEWNSDILVVREHMRWPDGRTKPITNYASDNKPSIPTANKYADFLVSDMDARRLVRRSLVLENNLRFENTLSEEYLFCQKSLYYANVISLANDYTYVWYMQWEEGNISSSTHQSPVKSFDGRLYGIKEMLNFIEKNNAREIAYPYLYKKIFEHPVYRLMTTSMDQRNWKEESLRLGELRDAITGHWNDCIADKIKFTERAVIETLLTGNYSSIPAIRELGKRSANARKDRKLLPDKSLESKGIEAVLPCLKGLSGYTRHGLVLRQLNTTDIQDVKVTEEKSTLTFEVHCCSNEAVAIIERGTITFPKDPNTFVQIPLRLSTSNYDRNITELRLDVNYKATLTGKVAKKHLLGATNKTIVSLFIGDDEVRIHDVSVVAPTKSQNQLMNYTRYLKPNNSIPFKKRLKKAIKVLLGHA